MPDALTSIGTSTASAVRAQLLEDIKAVALRYLDVFGRPLGVTGEIAEYEAVTRLGLDVAEARQPGWDAQGEVRAGAGVERLQIKGRRLVPGAKRGQRVPGIDIAHDFDGVVLVLLNERYEATTILYQSAAVVRQRLTAPGSKARNERGSMSIEQFSRQATVLYSSPNPIPPT